MTSHYDNFIVIMRPDTLFSETRLLSQTLKQWTEVLHQGLEVTVAMRGVLELILLEGSTTVPGMARARGVSRQHIQQQVDALIERGLVAREDNPAHKRSTLIALTDKGRALIQNMRADELDALSRLNVGVSDIAMADAAHVLSSWRAALRSDAQRRALAAT